MVRCDALVVTALKLEADAVLAALAVPADPPRVESGGVFYPYVTTIRADGSPLTVAVCEAGVGNVTAALAVDAAVRALRPAVVVLSGIAAGRKDAGLGHVVVGEHVYFYEGGKDTEDGFAARPRSFPGDWQLIQIARDLRRDARWSTAKPDPEAGVTTVHLGPIVAGERVVDAEGDTTRVIAEHYGDALAIEMEGYGLHAGVRPHHGVRALVVRGVSDLAHGKAETDAKGWQPVAARLAAQFTVALLHRVPPREAGPAPATPQRAIAAPAALVGRDADVAAVGAALRPGARVVLTGPSGIGKSSIAAAGASLWREARPGATVWWLDGTSADTMRAGLSDLAVAVGVAATGDSLGAVRAWLSTQQDVLLVADAVRDAATIHEAIPGPVAGGLLVTSLAPVWPPGYQAIEVAALDDEAARALLAAYGVAEADRDTIATLLGGLPLALVQAGGYLAESHLPVDRYVALLRDRTSDILDRGAPPDHARALSASIGLTVDELWEERPLAAALVEVLAVMAPAPVALVAVEAALEDGMPPFTFEDLTVVDLYDAVAAAERVGLVRHADGALTMHALTQAVVADRVAAEDTGDYVYAAGFVALYLGHHPDTASSAEALAHLEHVAEPLVAVADSPWLAALVLIRVAGLLLSVGSLAGALGRAARTRDIVTPFVTGDEAASLRARYEVDDWQLDDVLDRLDAIEGLALADVGRPAEAKPVLQRAVDRAEAAGDPRRLARCLNNLSIAYHRLGEDGEAVRLMERAIDLDVAAGSSADVLCRRWDNIARGYEALGDVPRARAALEQALAQARSLDDGGDDARAAVANYEAAVAALGREHDDPLTLAALRADLAATPPHDRRGRAILTNNIALALYDTGGDPDESLMLMRESLADACGVWDQDSPEIEIRRRNLAFIALRVGDVATTAEMVRERRAQWVVDDLDDVPRAQWHTIDAHGHALWGEVADATAAADAAAVVIAAMDDPPRALVDHLAHVREVVAERVQEEGAGGGAAT